MSSPIAFPEKSFRFRRNGLRLRQGLLAAAVLIAPRLYADFNQTAAGPYDYANTANWDGGTVNGVFSKTLTANQTVRFNSDATLLTGLDFHFGGSFNLSLTAQNPAAQSVTADSASETISLTGHGFSDGNLVSFASGTMPSGLVANTTYYVVNATTDSFQLAVAPGAAPIAFATNGASLTLTRAYGIAPGGDISVAPAASGRIVTVGNAAAASQLGVAFGSGTRQIGVSGGSTLTFANAVSGSGTLVKTGDGSLIFSHAQASYGGSLEIRGGSVSVTPGLFGNGSGSFTLGSADPDEGAAVTLTVSTIGAVSSANSLIVRSTNQEAATRTLNAGNGNGFTFTGPIELGDGSGSLSLLRVLGGSGSGPVLTGAISEGSGSVGSLSFNTVSDVKMSGSTANTYSGKTTIEKGTLVVNKTGGAISIPGDLSIGNATGNAAIRLDNPNQMAASTVIYFDAGAGNTAKVNVGTNGGNQQMAGLSGNVSGSIQATASNGATHTLTLSGTGVYDFAGTLRDTETTTTDKLAIKKTGPGTQIFSGNNAYSGATDIANGTLALTGTHSGAGAYTVRDTGVLAGTGLLSTANASVTIRNGATLAPGGASPGTLSMALGTGKLTLESGSKFAFTLGSVSDRLNLVSGSLDIGSGWIDLASFDFTPGSGFGPDTYLLFQTTGSITGTLGSGTTGLLSGYGATLAIQGNNLVLQVVPEPDACLLAGAGLLAMMWIARKRAGAARD